MGATCYVVGCKSGHSTCKEKAHFFKPKDLKTVKEWDKFIGRKDRKLNKKHSICHKHFEDADIIREQVLKGKNGIGPIVIELCRWKLTDEAVPKLLTGKPITNSKPPRRVLRRTPLSEVPALRGVSANKIPEKRNINFKDVALPSSWFWQQGSLQKQELICSKFKWLDENHFEYTKTVIINEDNCTLRYFLRGQNVLHENLKSQFSTINELYTYIKLFDDAQVCIGNPGFPCNFFLGKSKCSQSTKQNVQSSSEKNISEKSSSPPSKTSNQQSLATPKFLILQQSNFNKIIGETEKTSTQGDHTDDVATEQSIPSSVEIRPESFSDETLPIADSVVPRDDHSRSNSPNITSVDISQNFLSEDEFTVLPQMTDGTAVSLRYPNEFFHGPISNSIELEQKLVKRSYRCVKSNYNLVSYLLETWKLGVYTPFKFTFGNSFTIDQHKASLTMKQPIVNDWTSFRQPTFLIALPQKVYCRRKVTSNDTSMEPTVKSALKLTDIENMKSFNGKIHVTLNGESLVQLSLSNLFQDESNYYDYQPIPLNASKRGHSRDLIWDVEVEKDENDLKDLQLAKRLLRKEGRRKHMLLKQLHRLLKNCTESKDLARSVLKASKKCRLMRPENEVAEQPNPPAIAKKPAPLMKCQQCNKMILVSRMKTHLKVHSGVKPHLCDLCGRAFVCKSSLNSHIRINHGKEAKPFMCSTCGYTCRRKQLLDNHERIHTNERPFECSICDKRFRSNASLAIHKRTHTGEKRYTCSICAKSYSQSKSLKKHFKNHHENTGPNGGNKVLQFTGSAKISYHCEFCQKQFWRFLTYEKHRATHTGVAAAVRCAQPNCDFTYSDMTQLKNHMLTQHPEKAYTCDVCGKVFLAKHTLKDHQALHDPTLGFQCSYCPARLTVKANLIAHEKNHTRDTPFKCSYCELRFFSTYMLHMHTRKYHPASQPKRKRISKKPSEK